MNTHLRKAITALVSFIFAILAFKAKGELRHGRYVGYLQLDNQTEKFAATVDFFPVQPPIKPEEKPISPQLNAILKINLGSYNSSEYISENFEDIQGDFNNEVITLNERQGDFYISAKIAGSSLQGKVWIRSIAVYGRLEVQWLTDEPPDGDEEQKVRASNLSDVIFRSPLNGQYEGFCGSKKSAMQIQTGKGLLSRAQPHEVGLRGYGIVARIAYDDPLCVKGDQRPKPGDPAWCVMHTYNGGYYNLFNGKLILTSDTANATECKTEDSGRLNCRVRLLGESVNCQLQRINQSQPASFKSYVRSFSVSTTADQRQPLPLPSPPSHIELANTIGGDFYGYIHNETNDRYQPINLQVITSLLTDNLHNENKLYVTATAITYFGRGTSEDFFIHSFDQRRFYLRPGFVLESANADGFFQIDEWWTGSIRGVWYSHEFGRVGTVQLVKADKLPPLPIRAKAIPSGIGEFDNTGAQPKADPEWWFKSFMPTQPVWRDQSYLSFEGETELLGGIGFAQRIVIGSYDFYNGYISWLAQSPRNASLSIVSGYVDEMGMSLFWPGGTAVVVPMAPVTHVRFNRISTE